MSATPWLFSPAQSLPAAAALVTAALAATLLVYALHKLRSPDPIVQLGWGLGGAVAIGTGWWSAHACVLLALGLPDAYRGEALFVCWLIAMGGALAVLGVARACRPLRWRAAAAGAALALAQALVLRTMAAVPAVQPLPLFAEEAWLVAALAATPMCGAALWLLGDGPRGSLAAHARRGLIAAGVLVAASVIVAVVGWPALEVPPHATAAANVPLDGASIWPLAAAGTLALLMALLGALVDARSGGRTRQLAASLHDANDRLRRLAFCDPLTGLPNRLLFEERLALALEHVGRTPAALAVLFIDLDGFKPINDSFGHAAGDEVLREVGLRLEALAGERETVARIGGDEFLLMLEQPDDRGAAAALAQRALQALNRPYALQNAVEVSLSCSIGISLFPEHGPMAKLIPNADAAMYAAKGVGGSTFAFFEPRMDMDSREQVELQRDLRGALERGELQLYYQPKVDGRTGEVTGAEALVRWAHPQRGTVLPSVFIPIAERFGLIGALGSWVIDEACRQIRRWLDDGLKMRVAVNLSVHQLRQDDLVPRIRRAVLEHRIDPRQLTFEITESVAMDDAQTTLQAFSHLAQVGVSLSIDDFGTGYSSLAYLRKLPARQLKIDRSFVADLDHSADALAVVDAVVSLAHALGLKVVAEGVETERQRDILLGLRCDELQGYLYAKPMSAKALMLWAMDDRTSRTMPFRAPLFQDDDDTVRMPLQ